MTKYDEKSCGMVLFRENKGENLFLILHYPNGHWDLVKGHVEGDESEHETAARELEEETGIKKFQFINGYREQISYKYLKEGKLSNKEVIFFLAKTKKQDVNISHEHHDHIWLPYDDALEKITYENAKKLLRKAKSFLQL